MKAIIPVAGAGTRLRPHTYTQPKPLIPVGGKTIISFIIDQLSEAGITEFIFIIGYLGEKIKSYIEKQYPNLVKHFVYQHERKGSGHAIWMAKEYIQNEKELMVVFGDTIFETDLKKMITQKTSCLAVKRVDNPREFGVTELGENGLVKKVVEKPKIPKTNYAMVGAYWFTDVEELIEAIEYNMRNNIHNMGEFQLTGAIMHMINNNIPFTTIEVNNWFDCGKKDILLETNAMLLKKAAHATSNHPKQNNIIIIPPVHIGMNCKLSNCIIGPNVSIGDNVILEHTIVKESIIGNFATIKEVVLHHSVVGNDASITGLSQSLNIGDNTEIDFG